MGELVAYVYACEYLQYPMFETPINNNNNKKTRSYNYYEYEPEYYCWYVHCSYLFAGVVSSSQAD